MPERDPSAPLPNLVIIGERRSGTTWLSQLIARHPAVFVHPKRDRGYFIDDDARKRKPAPPWEDTHSIDDYASMFRGLETAGHAVICEKSADYLFWRPAHERLARFLPEARFIAILRHPVKRAWSHYWIEVGKGRETEDFATALALEEERSASRPYQHNHLSYRARGRYDESIGGFLSVVPRERLHVLTLEDLVADRATTMRGVFDFLGVDDVALPETGIESQNRNWVMTPKAAFSGPGLSVVARGYGAAVDAGLKLVMPDRDRRRRMAVALKSPLFDPASDVRMDPSCERDLASGFSPHVRRLETILGRSFGQWGL